MIRIRYQDCSAEQQLGSDSWFIGYLAVLKYNGICEQRREANKCEELTLGCDRLITKNMLQHYTYLQLNYNVRYIMRQLYFS